ncbi:hypothetical protein F4779DRAFT_239435 [Xylariaceae sp. FL0662B]|nr:hypothetical protein F4779DRAFT_239435 [Xylariaceae sp. FL0662B]
MAPKTSAGAQLSQRDMEVLAKAWHCFENEPTINWQKLAEVAGFKNGPSARACFLPIKKKLISYAKEAEGGDGASTVSAPTPSPAKSTPAGTPRKRKADMEKTPRSTKKARAAVTNVDDDDDDDDCDQQDYGKMKVKKEANVVIKEENKEDGEV